MALMNKHLKDFWETRDVRYRILYGGRASSKSYDAVAELVRLTSKFKTKVLAARQFQNKITESVYTLIVETIQRFGLEDQYSITERTIKHKFNGSEFIFLGIWRNIDEIKSTEGIDILYIEEAHALTEQQWDILNPTIRKRNSEIWCVFNPRSRLDFSWKRLVENPLPKSVVRKINYDENEFLSDTMLEVIEDAKKEDYEKYEHVYLGYPNESSETALFTYKDIDRAMSRNAEATGATVIGVDIARYGSDSTVITVRTGLWVKSILQRKNLSVTEVADWVHHIYNITDADAVIVDSIGLGAGLLDILITKGVRVVDGNVGFKAADTDTYFNKRAEAYFKLADAVKRGLALPRDSDELAEELLSVEYTFSENGKVKIMPKDKMKEVLGRSPDLADSLMLTYFTDIYKSDDAGIADNFIPSNLF